LSRHARGALNRYHWRGVALSRSHRSDEPQRQAITVTPAIGSLRLPKVRSKKASDRIKTNRRDAESLAKPLRAGELTPVWVPDEAHEAMRDLSRAREAAVGDLKRKRKQMLSLCLRHGPHYPGKTTWSTRHRVWLVNVKLAERSTRIAIEELMAAEREAQARLDRLNAAIRDAVPEWLLAPQVVARQAMRGIDLITAVVLLAEIGDVSRFSSAPELMAWLGLVSSESSTATSSSYS
jgi:transposase